MKRVSLLIVFSLACLLIINGFLSCSSPASKSSGSAAQQAPVATAADGNRAPNSVVANEVALFVAAGSNQRTSTRDYQGSSFNEVRAVVSGDSVAPTDESDTRAAAEIAEEQAVYRSGALPAYRTTVAKIVNISFAPIGEALRLRAQRTLNDKVDYYPRLDKLIHSNGVCLTGTWQITEKSPYSGYFAEGKKGLFIGRASTALNQTTSDGDRAFGFAGKLFPTLDPEQKVKTANFFSVDNLTGTPAKHFLDVALTNQPTFGVPSSIEDTTLAAIITKSLLLTDGLSSIGFRPLYPISEAGITNSETVRTPRWIQIRAASSTSTRIDELDFRRELDVSKYPAKAIELDILVSDTTHETGPRVSGWKKLGKIQLTESFISYGCDRRLHFPHPREK